MGCSPQAWNSLFGFVPNHFIQGNAFLAGRLLRLVLDKFQLLGFGGKLFKRFQIFAEILFGCHVIKDVTMKRPVAERVRRDVQR